MTDVLVYDAIRTPRGKGKRNGALSTVKPIDLVVGLIQEMRGCHPELDPNLIDDVILGVVSPVADQGSDIAKVAALAAGLPPTVAGVQLNRFCASGLEAVNTAAQKEASGWDSLILAGGVGSMSPVPLGSDGDAYTQEPATAYDGYLVPQGVAADLVATMGGFSRTEVDTYAARSHARAAAAWSGGYFAKSVNPVRDRTGQVILDHDQLLRPETTAESLGALPLSFAAMGESGGFDAVALQTYHTVERINHVHHAGNSSGIVDGAALVLIGNAQVGTQLGLAPGHGSWPPRSRERSRPSCSPGRRRPPARCSTRPACGSTTSTWMSSTKRSRRSCWSSSVTSASPTKVNVNGGAIAMGRPLGATGAMLVGTMVVELERRSDRRALITLCVGAGMGIATIIERV